MFTKLGVYTKSELAARKAIYAEQYISTISIEVRTLLEMVHHQILPAMTADLKDAGEAAAAAGTAAPKYLTKHVSELSKSMDELVKTADTLEKDFAALSRKPADGETGKEFYYTICPEMEAVRAVLDTYEVYASRKNYPLPTYEDMLFSL